MLIKYWKNVVHILADPDVEFMSDREFIDYIIARDRVILNLAVEDQELQMQLLDIL